MSQAPEFLETYSIVTGVIVFMLLFGGLGLALARSPLSVSTRIRIWLVLFLVVLVVRPPLDILHDT